MKPATIEGLMTIGTAVLLMGLSIPLILRKVPMNSTDGFRIPRAFKSEKNWYDINAAGGKVMFWASIPVLLLGVFHIVAPAAWKTPWITMSAAFLPVVVCVAFALRGARKIDEENEAAEKNADS